MTLDLKFFKTNLFHTGPCKNLESYNSDTKKKKRADTNVGWDEESGNSLLLLSARHIPSVHCSIDFEINKILLTI